MALVACALSAVAVKTCGSETSTPGPTAERQRPSPPPLMSVPPLQPASPLGPRSKPRLSKTTMKRYRIETCYFGSVGVAYARESYWETLGPELPSSLNVPNFGDYPEHKPRRPGGRLPVAATIGRLPFEQHLRACTSAKTLKGVDDYTALIPALEKYEKYISGITRTLNDAARYYARSEWKRDKFKKGMELHEKLSDELADFETRHATYGKAVAAWFPSVGPLREEGEFDTGAKLAKAAVGAARTLTHLLLDGDKGGVSDALATTKKAAAALKAHGERDAESPHPRIVGRKLDEFVKAAEEAAALDKLGVTQRYFVGYGMGQLLDAEQRALAQLLGGDEDSFGGRLRPLAPRLKGKNGKLARPALPKPPKPPTKAK
jgi:hypothetical protein